jgi:hypothetical protein
MRRYGFHDTDLNENVRYAYQALAIDERRGPFKPTLWTRKKPDASAPTQKLQQVWFAGCHSNVGGGYDDHGLSDISLLWMAAKAKEAAHDHNHRPLAFDEGYFNKENFDSGMGTLFNSRAGIWRFMPRHVRRLMEPRTDGTETCETIHHSVVTRYEASDRDLFKPKRYRPKNARQHLAPKNQALIEAILPFEEEIRPNYAPDRS